MDDTAFAALALTATQRPALPRIDYAADDGASVAARLHERLPDALPGWNAALAPSGGDHATLLVDLYAHLAGTLLAYADQRANESYLRTAALPRSLIDLAALVDHRIGGGASASALQAFFAKPGQAGTLPAGFRIHARAGGADQVFETLAALDVHASRNDMRLAGWDRSARVLRLGATAAAFQDVQAALDQAYPGLKAGTPLVFETPTGLAAAPIAAADPGASSTQVRWAAGAAALAAELPLADLTLLARPRQAMRLAAAERADEITLGQHQLPVANAQMFTVGSAVLVHSGGLQMPALVLAKTVSGPGAAGTLTLQRGVVASLRRSDTRVLEGTACGATTATLRAGTTTLQRDLLAKKKDFPHTPAPGDLLLVADASGVDLVHVASASGATLQLAQPLLRAMRPVAQPFDSTPRVRFYSVAPAHPATHQTALRPLLLGELAGVFDGGQTLLALDRSCDGLEPGTVLALADGQATRALRVAGVDHLNGRTTVRLHGSAPASLRVATLHISGPFEHRMRVAGWNRSDQVLPPGTAQLDLAGDPVGLAAGQDLIVSDGSATEGARIAQVESRPGATRVALAWPLQAAFRQADTRVQGNVAAISHGAGGADEVLGSGDAAQAPLRLALRRAPLAFVPDATAERGVAPALQVWVGGQLWQRVETLAGSGPLDRHYAVEIGPDQRAQVVFGDGRHGAVPASGRNNIVARYRTGHGAQANVAAGAIASMPTPAVFIARSVNLLPASGGDDRDSPEHTRAAVARHVRTLERAVTLQDHADLAMAYAGVAQARADLQREGQGPGARRHLVVTVAARGGTRLAPPQQEALLAWLMARSAAPQPLRVRSHRAWPVRAALQVSVVADRAQADVQRALWQALGASASAGAGAGAAPGFFAFERRSLGSALHLSDLYACVEAVPGVDHALATLFHAESQPAGVRDRIEVPADAQASGGDASDAAIGRLTLQLSGGLA